VVTGTATRAKKAKTKNGVEPSGESRTSERTGVEQHLTISAPNMETVQFTIRGLAPFVQCKFSQKAIATMRKTQELGSVAAKGKKREPKDFDGLFEGAIHWCGEGKKRWAGIPANGIRAALVSACRTVGFAMTKAKLAVFVEGDGFDFTEGTPLVKFTKGKPRHVEHAVRIQNTTDIRVRAMWDPGWEAKVRVRFDADMFAIEDVTNLLARVGMQVGLGEGRPDSRSSAGMGWGLFEIVQ
jgi:hypothetical protein